MPTQLERTLIEWDRHTKPLEVYYGNTGQTLARNADTVRHAIRRLGIDATARAESASKSVIVERRDDAA